MSINTAHVGESGVLLYADEKILLFSDNVTIEFPGQIDPVLRDAKFGNIYLTTHRMIFTTKMTDHPLKSFSFPFVCLNRIQVNQPIFGASNVSGTVIAQSNGNFIGYATFKLTFQSVVTFGQALKHAVMLVQQSNRASGPPAYIPLGNNWTESNSTEYLLDDNIPWFPHTVSPITPHPRTVFIHNTPSPFWGILQSMPRQSSLPIPSAPSPGAASVIQPYPSPIRFMGTLYPHNPRPHYYPVQRPWNLQQTQNVSHHQNSQPSESIAQPNPSTSNTNHDNQVTSTDQSNASNISPRCPKDPPPDYNSLFKE